MGGRGHDPAGERGVELGRNALRPFAAIQNVFDRKYVGSVNLNGAGGRILEPAPGRSGYLGLELEFGTAHSSP